MKKDLFIDYASFMLFRFFSFLLSLLPCSFKFFLGRRLGGLLYCLDAKNRRIAYVNLKTAFADKLSTDKLRRLVKDFYRGFGQSLVEIFLIPKINKKYIDKYITFDGFENIALGFKQGKGVIFAVVHECNWEASNIVSSNLGWPFSILIRQQSRYRLLNDFLNRYRSSKGAKLIQRKNQTKGLILALNNNEAVGITVDQGGNAGVLVNFFGRAASMPTGAIKLALKYQTAIIPVFSTRLSGPRIKFIIGAPFEIKKTGDDSFDIRENLQRLTLLFEKYITQYPKEYLWTYKIWKYAKEREILVLSDTKAGHLRQSEKVARIIGEQLKDKGISFNIKTVKVVFRNNFSKAGLILSRGNLKRCLNKETYGELSRIRPDIVVSCGSSLAPVNYLFSRENQSRAITIMRPSLISTKRFALAIIPKHDRPARGDNVVVTEGALNLIDEEYLKECISHIAYRISQRDDKRLAISDKRLFIGLLIGGDTKNFCLKEETVSEVIKQIKTAAENLDADILVTTSRRTSKGIEELLRVEFANYSRCKLLVIANERNIPEAVGGILGLSQIVVTSPESISMISEAASSKRYVIVFEAKALSRKHRDFLGNFAENKYIYLTQASSLSKKIEQAFRQKPALYWPKDDLLVTEAIRRIV